MEFLLLSAKLQDCYNALRVAGEDDLSIYCPVVGQAYVAHYDKFWYRAQVIGGSFYICTFIFQCSSQSRAGVMKSLIVCVSLCRSSRRQKSGGMLRRLWQQEHCASHRFEEDRG